MTTIGYVFILIAFLLIRGLTKGRSISQLPGELGAMFDAVVSGDTTALKAALNATGDTNSSTVTPTGAAPAPGPLSAQGIGTQAGSSLLAEMHRIGSGKPYVFGATGPGSFDCSGLVWRAMKNLGIYTGLRFTTVTFALQLASKVTKVANPTVGDIVVWSVPQHMGVVDGPDSFYSALNHAEGIRSASISGMGGSPRFYRIKGPNVSTFIDPTLGLARTIPTAPLGQM